MSNRFRWIASVAFVFLMTTAVAFGQATTGMIEGTIKDQKGDVIPGASVTVSGTNVGFNRTVTTNSNGFYRIERVPAGSYKVTVAPISGFSAATLDAFVNIEKTTTADITMGVASQEISVDVAGDALGVAVDTTDSKIQTNITSELIDKLPSGTSFSSILKINPATRGESLTGGFQVDGASKAENSFVLDGQEISSYRDGTLDGVNNVPTALIKEVQIKVSGFEAEHGGASGGVVVVTTKSGSNEFHGEFGTQFATSRLQPNNRFAPGFYWNGVTGAGNFYRDVAIQQPKDSALDFYPTASLGGKIIKDRLWFYGIYSPQIFTGSRVVNFYNSFSAANGATLVPSTTQTQGQTYQWKQTYEYAQGRLDYSLFNNLSGFTSYLWNPRIIEGLGIPAAISVGGTVPSQPGYTERGPDLTRLKGGRENSNVFNTQLSWTPFSNFVLNGRYGHGFLNSKGSSYAAFFGANFRCLGNAAYDTYTSGAAGCARGFATSTTGNGGAEFEISKRDSINVDASYFFRGFGSHNLKGGYEYTKLYAAVKGSTASVNTEGRMDLYYGFDPVVYGINIDPCFPVTCVGFGQLIRYGEGGAASNKVQVLYLQDKWQIGGRLTLNLGIRAENENLPAFNVEEGSIALPIDITWGRKIVPRLGASFDLFGNGKTRLFGSYGWFTDRMKFELPIGSFGGAVYYVDEFPILASNPQYSYYTRDRILGNWPLISIGGGNPSTMGGLSQYQVDYRVPSNLRPEDYEALVGFPIVGVDPDLKPFMQEEFSVGFESELNRQWVLSARYTRKNLLNTLEDIGYIDNHENEYYTIGNPGKGVAVAQREAMGITHNVEAKRLYNAFEINLTRRFSNNWFFSANYTLSSLKGNTSGLANSDYWDGGCTDGSCGDRASPGVNRFFDQPISGFTVTGEEDYGVLATDRPHVVKAYGGYTFDWWKNSANATELSFFTTAMSGTPQTTVVCAGGECSSGGIGLPLTKRGDMGRTETFTQTDLTLSHSYKFGRDGKFKLIGDITATNAFNENNVTALNPRRWLINTIDITSLVPNYDPNASGFDYMTAAQMAVINGQAGALVTELDRSENRNPIYGKPSSYQAKRGIRFGFRLQF